MSDTKQHRAIHFLGNNVVRVLVSGDDADGAYCVLEMITQPGGGATALHIDRFAETFHVLEGEVEWTLERAGTLETWIAQPGETICVPHGVPHRFVGRGAAASRMLAIGVPRFEQFFRALSEAWQGPYDRQATPAAVAPVFERFGVSFIDS